MRKLVISLGLAVILHLSALGQVDTLQLLEVNSVAFPGGNPKVYISNIDNDSTEEIVVCTQVNIAVYNYPALNSVWNSPNSNWTDKAVFFDWNQDGHLDIALADTSVKIFDITNNQMLWASQRIDAYGASSFDLGDLNEDNFIDAVIVRQGSSVSHDSIYIDIFYGPEMELSGHYSFIPSNIAGAEGLSRAIVAQLSGSQGERTKIILLTNVYNSYNRWDPPDEWCMFEGHWGKIYLIDPSDFRTVMIDTTGYELYRSYSSNDSINIYLYAITQRFSQQDGTICHPFRYKKVSQWTISADTVIYTKELFYNTMWDPYNRDWKYFALGDIDYSHAGDEICYGLYDTLWLYSYPDFTPIWRDTITTNSNPLNGIYHNNSIYSEPLIMISPFLINGSNGQIAARTNTSIPTWTAIKDLDHNGEDELILLSWRNSQNCLLFYRLQLASTGIDENNALPILNRLYPNYPNPFNASTTIEYDIIKDEQVKITIYDLLGRNMINLVNQKEQAGHHKITWKAGDLSSGIYFYKITAGDYSETKRMLLVK